MIKQNIVFIENKAGSLQKVTELLAEAGIDIYGFACFDAPEFALFRMITNQADEAEKLLSENLDYIYTSYHRENSLPIMILQTDDVFVTENVLSNNGFRVLNSLED